MKRPVFTSEAELAAVVIAWLQADGYEVFQEVECGDVADIVATRGSLVIAVECKLHMNLDVLAQAQRWQTKAHLTWAAAPAPRRNHDAWGFATAACGALGLGLLEVHPAGSRYGGDVRQRVAPKTQPHDASRLLAVLRPEHKTYAAAGSPTGHRWTRFRETERDLVAYVRAHPGVLARDALKAVPHHWRSKSPAGRCVVCIRTGIMKGLRVESDGRAVRLYAIETAREEAERRLRDALARDAPDAQVAALAAALDAVAGS